MLQSAISIQNNSSLDDLTSSSTLMNHQKNDVNITPAPLIATQLEDDNNNINEEEVEEEKQKDISSYLQKHLNLIVSRSNLSADDQKDQSVIQKPSYKRLPPKFGVLYANKTTSTNDETQQKHQNETEIGSSDETSYSVIQNKPKSHINLTLQETGPKIPPSLHHPMYQYPSNSNQTTTHLLNPLLFGRNTVTTTTNSTTNPLSSSNTSNRFEILMKSKNFLLFQSFFIKSN
jgi:hypothetical protein